MDRPGFLGGSRPWRSGARPTALDALLAAAVAAGAVRGDVAAADLLRAVANLSLPADALETGHAQRMVALLIDGLRCGGGAARDVP